MENERIIKPIAYIKSDFNEKFGIPRQSGLSPSSEALVIFTPEFRDPAALREIERYNYLWLIFDFSKAHTQKFSPTVRPPRLGGNTRVGVFATRSPFRPNSLGLSSVKLLGVEKNDEYGVYLRVGGADILNGTPIYDVKPYIKYCDMHIDAHGGFSDGNAPAPLKVVFTEKTKSVLPEDKKIALEECLAQDPRPAYDEDGEIYKMKFFNRDVTFTVSGGVLTVTEIE